MHVLARILSSILVPGMRMQTCALCRLCNEARVSHALRVQSEHSEHMYIHPHMTVGGIVRGRMCMLDARLDTDRGEQVVRRCSQARIKAQERGMELRVQG